MEKKTLGSFIAVLRKSRGMTQKELAEKLGVSDKTISHWERDENSPDISMIPVIAEIFDVTCDELLKGEKIKNTNESFPENNQKQLKYLLEKSYSKFRTQCLILTGVALIGFVFAFLAYWEWAWNFSLVNLIFFIGSVFGLVIFKIQNKTAIYTENIDDELTEKYQKKSREIFWYSILINVMLQCATFNYGGFILSPIVGSIFYLILRLTKQITFKSKGQIIEKNIVKTVSVVLILILSFSFLFFEVPEIISAIKTPPSVHFENMEELKSFMETEKPLPEYASGDRGTNTANTIDYKNGEYVWQCYGDSEEEIIIEFVWRNNEIQHIEFFCYENGDYTAEAMFFEKGPGKLYYAIDEPIFYSFYPVVIISAVLICVFKTKKKLKHTET